MKAWQHQKAREGQPQQIAARATGRPQAIGTQHKGATHVI